MRIMYKNFSNLLSVSLVCLIVGILGVFEPAIARESTVEPAIAFAARVVGDENRARLIVDFNRTVEHDVYVQDGPDRIFIDLPETLFSLSDEAKQMPSSAILAMRFGRVSEGQSRIILDLNDAVKIEKHSLKPISGGNRHRLIVDLVKSSRLAFTKSVRPPKLTKIKLPEVEPRQFKIVLDPGHGGIDGGASGRKGAKEKNITLEFALRLKEALENNPAFSVGLTREGDDFVALKERVSLARQKKADLMISIHADSLNQTRIRGATVYTLSEEGSDDLSRALARKQNRADLIAGLSLPAEKPKVADILIDLMRRESEAFSVRAARLLISHMQNDIKLIRNPHRSADFFVLKAPEVPSILLELGYLSNKMDEKLMQSQVWQAKAVARTKEAIEAFFAPRLAQR